MELQTEVDVWGGATRDGGAFKESSKHRQKFQCRHRCRARRALFYLHCLPQALYIFHRSASSASMEFPTGVVPLENASSHASGSGPFGFIYTFVSIIWVVAPIFKAAKPIFEVIKPTVEACRAIPPVFHAGCVLFYFIYLSNHIFWRVERFTL